jgi:hypothetical protein
LPNCGTVAQRLASGLYEFKDPKGRSPVSYVKILEKLGITQEQVEATGKDIDAEHFEAIVKVSKAHRGRPKKQSTGIVAEHVNDLFNQLIPDEQENEEETLIMEEVAAPAKKSSKKVVSEEEKQAKKDALEQEREAKKAEREMQRLAEKEAKRVEKELKLAEEKAAKEAKIAEEKAAKELKRQQEKEAKEALKAQNPTSKKAKEVTAEPVAVAAPVQAPTKVSVSRITIEGVEYLKSATNILYDTKTKEEVGLYDPVSKTMKELPEEDEEEVESEYEEDEDN